MRSWVIPLLLAGVALAFDAADHGVPFSVLASGPLADGMLPPDTSVWLRA